MPKYADGSIGDLNLDSSGNLKVAPPLVAGDVEDIVGDPAKTLADIVTALAAVKSAALVKVGGGTKTVAATGTPEALTASSVPCRFILIQPIRNADGVATNTKAAFIGDVTSQTAVVCPNDVGFFIPAANANAVYAKVGANGEGVTWTAYGYPA